MGFYEVDVSLHFRDVVVPLILVFDGDMAVEILFLQFFKAGSDVHYAFTRNDHFGLTSACLVLEVDTDDATVEDSKALDGFEVGSAPVAQVSAGADTFVATFYKAADVKRVPDFVIRIAHGAAVLVEGNFHIGAYCSGSHAAICVAASVQIA